MMGGQRTYVTLVLVVIVVVIHSTCGQVNNNYEGDACKFQNGSPGICRRAKNCPGFRPPVRGKPSPPICGFLGTGLKSEPIICCASKSQPMIIPPVKPTTPTIGNRLGGEKSKKACEDFSRVRTTITGPRSVIPLILSGEDAAPGEFPHMALLGYASRGPSLKWACGGALISDRYVLTAAHCLRTRDGNPVRVRLGEHDISNQDRNFVDYGVQETILHPDYARTNAKSWYDDIGLIRLNMNVKFTYYIFPACLYTQSEEPLKNLIVTGWGDTNGDGSSSSDILQKGKTTIDFVPSQQCNNFYPVRQVGNRLSNGIQSGMFCAGDPNGSVDTCQGDSGGPIQLAVELTRDISIYQVVGVTSGGAGCGGAPAIYSRVYHYLEWIETIVWP